MTDPLDWLDDALADLDRRGLRRLHRIGTGGLTLGFGSNDYLGLARDPRLAEAARRAAERHGWGAGASPSVCGRTEVHAELEERLARFEGAEGALLFPTGFAANAGVVPALVDAGDALYSDAKNHASLIDGCRLARAERHVFPHGDTATLAELLADGARYRRRLIVTDTLFSMDGDFAPLGELAQLAVAHDAMLLVDEAHATGVWGQRGTGLVEHFAAAAPEVERAALVRVGTLSKGLGASGGFVSGPKPLIDWLANRARPYVFSTAPPAPAAAAALAALEIVEAEPQRRLRVRTLADTLRDRLAAEGWDTGASRSQVVPIRVGDPEGAVALSGRLAERGLFVPAIRPPTVPAGESLLRVSLTASHTEEDLDRLVTALRAVRPV